LSTFRTFGDLSAQVKQELDIEVEEFIQPAELINYFNTGMNLIEAELMKIGQKDEYLKGEAFISIVTGTDEYDLPNDIVYEKIRKIIYRESNSLIYELKKMVVEGKYETQDVLRVYNSTSYYMYDLYQVGTVWKIRIYPSVTRTITNALRIIYWKTINRYVLDADLCNIPSICYDYLLAYIRYRVYMKETHVNTSPEKEQMMAFRQLMIETLQNQVEDPDTTRNDLDTSFYEEFS